MTTYIATFYSSNHHKWYELSTTAYTYEQAMGYFYSKMEDNDILLKVVDDRGYLV